MVFGAKQVRQSANHVAGSMYNLMQMQVKSFSKCAYEYHLNDFDLSLLTEYSHTTISKVYTEWLEKPNTSSEQQLCW